MSPLSQKPVLTLARTLLAALVAASAGAVAAAGQAHEHAQANAAADAASPAVAADAAYFLTYENDRFFRTDRYYTNGIEFAVKRGDGMAASARPWTRRLCGWFGCEDATLATRQSSFGQLMYTPQDITVRAPQPQDRPWAGLLYYEQAFGFLSPDRRTLTTFTAQAGVTGRASLAEPTQKLAHRILDRPPPQGWDNQIGGSLAVMASAERRSAVDALSFELGNDIELNTASYWRVGVGNIMTYAAGGVAVVVGKNLPAVSAAPPGIGNTFKGRTLEDTSCFAPWLQCTAFGSVETRLVGYNVFLDGRLFRNDPQVKRRNLVTDLKLGLRFDFPDTRSASHGPWFVQFKITRRSPEFRSNVPGRRHLVGAITFGTEF